MMRPVRPARPLKIPRSLAAAADLLYTLRQQRYDLNAKIDTLKEQELALRDHLLRELPTTGATGVAGTIGSVNIVPKVGVRVLDRDTFRTYVVRHHAWELMTQGVNAAAVRERWDEGKEVPGLAQNPYNELSITKV